MSHKRQAYASDLTDDQWGWLEPQLEDRLTQNWLGRSMKLDLRDIVVDTLGNLLEVVVHAANIQDYHGAKHVLCKVTETVTTLQRIWADGIYEKDGLVEWVRNTLKIALDVVNVLPTSRASLYCQGVGL